MSGSKTRVTLLMGGWSNEREVSLTSARECAAALERLGYAVTCLDMGRDIGQKLPETRPDIVFNALHGRFGEDGTIQGLLDMMGVPYTHSGVLASSLAMDKEKTKLVYRDAGLPVAQSRLATKADIAKSHVMAPPYVVKPFNEGSSVGVYIVTEDANDPPQIADEMADVLMVEAYIAGRELTTTVLGDRALGVTEIVAGDGGWYDYAAKYEVGGSKHVLPAQIPQDIYQICMDYALRAHQALGCAGMTRTDFRWDEDQAIDGLFLLETNTQPGMTPTSLAPEQAAFAGIEFDDLIQWMVEDAKCCR